MEKIIVAFSYILIKMAEEFVDNIIKINNKQNPENYTIKDKLHYFNYENDFSITKCNLFPFLITVANGDKKELNTFFNGFLPLKDGFVQSDLFCLIKQQDKFEEFFKLFTFSDSNLKIDIDLIEINDNCISIKYINKTIFPNDNSHANVDNDTIQRIDNSMKHLSNAVKYFPNRYVSFLSYLSKDNTPYRKYSFLFDNDTMDIKTDYKHIIAKESIKSIITSDYIDSNYKFPLTPTRVTSQIDSTESTPV